MEGVMMCRVIAPLAVLIRREAVSRSRSPSPLQRRLRILRHRALRWFGDPIATVERERRERELGPSVWRHAFLPRTAVARPAYARRAARRLTLAGY
jgi:hypothetical protein